jgi:Resolvase, N terminal domain
VHGELQMIGAVAQFERSLIGERVRAGIENARKNGKVLGRPALGQLSALDISKLRKMRLGQRIPFRKLAEQFGVSVWTAHRLVRIDRTRLNPPPDFGQQVGFAHFPRQNTKSEQPPSVDVGRKHPIPIVDSEAQHIVDPKP